MTRCRRFGPAVLAFCLLSLGIWQLGAAGLIHAKAWLAQHLLVRAWADTLDGGQRVAPWPWADTYPIAKLAVPDLGVEQVVLAGASGRSLAFGPGHLDGTVRPGRPGHSVVTGHRDTHFTFLADLSEGDRLRVQTANGRWRDFEVRSLQVVDTRSVNLLPGGHRPSLTLVTCYPFDSLEPGGPLRYLVHAESL